MWTPEYILSQVCILFAVLSLGCSYFTKNRIVILFLSISNSIFYGLHYLFLKGYPGAILNFLGVVRGVWFYLNGRYNVRTKYTLISLFVILALLITGSALTFSAWYSILPLIATVTFTLSVWQKNIKVYRWAVIPIEICGILYNVLLPQFSILGIVFEGCLLISGIISIIKLYHTKPKIEPPKVVLESEPQTLESEVQEVVEEK